MTDLAQWQDDSDNALGGDFDGSLSGLCIMSLSFDFSNKNVPSSTNGPIYSLSSNNSNATVSKKVLNLTSVYNGSENNNLNLGQNNQILTNNGQATNSSNYYDMNRGTTNVVLNNDHINDTNNDTNTNTNNININNNNNNNSNSCSASGSGSNNNGNSSNNNCFKRFKASLSKSDISNENSGKEDEIQDDKMSDRERSDKVSRQITNLKNKLSPSESTSSQANQVQNMSQDGRSNQLDNELSPDRTISPSDESCHQVSSPSLSDETSRSLTPTSISASSRTSRSNSPAQDVDNVESTKRKKHSLMSRCIAISENHQAGSIYNVRDTLIGGSSIKESSYTTSLVTTTAPMHFKSRHHPFSLKQFPMSPYHQFSNSSLHHDMYDKYMSLDSHPPLQTPLIGFERTQDLLSIGKLPPHGPDDFDSQKFPREWLFDESRGCGEQQVKSKNITNDKSKNGEDGANAQDLSSGQDQAANKSKDPTERSAMNTPKGFPFNYKSNSNASHNDRSNQHEPIDLNVTYDHHVECFNGQHKNDSMFNQSMKHFNPDRLNQGSCFDIRSKQVSPSNNSSGEQGRDATNSSCIAQQYNGQESIIGIDPSRQKFQYVLSAPISVATKLNEDTMTYLNQAQAYEIKLENITDVSEVKKGFMCSIINIGFHERHMQQAENELWQQWSQQHPNEKIFSVDMKLSYNVFGVESDGLNKYEFLWDSSKVAGVFIRINSISTEFTLKKHGGEKGVPFKLSIETFSYNSKTHDSYFISAACCQIKVFKPKGAERKFRSDRDKISKRPVSEQEKYHRSCDQTHFSECSLSSLHPFSSRSNYYRHSHGHFASKQVVAGGNPGTSSSVSHHTGPVNLADDETDRCNNGSQRSNTPDRQLNEMDSGQGNHQRDFQNNSKEAPLAPKDQQEFVSSKMNQSNDSDNNCYDQHESQSEGQSNNQADISTQLPTQTSSFNQMYSHHHSNSVRSVASFAGINNTQHFGMAYYSHTLPSSLPTHITPPVNYGSQAGMSFNNMAHSGHGCHSLSMTSQENLASRCPPANVRSSNLADKKSIAQKPFIAPQTLALNHSFQSYLSQSEQPHDAQTPLDIKESGSAGNYHHEPCESTGQSIHSNNPNYPQQALSRPQRPATSNLANIGQTPSLPSHSTQNRHLDTYMNHPNNSLLESTINSNYWIHGSTNHHQPLTSPSAFSHQRHTMLTHQSGESYAYTTGITHQNIETVTNSNNYLHDNDSNNFQRSNQTTGDTLGYQRLKPEHSGTDYGDSHRASNQPLHITTNSNCVEVLTWLTANRFAPFIRAFNNFSGSDLLRLSKNELIEICGLSDGIRLNNCLHNQPIKPRKNLYICSSGNDVYHPIYLYDVSLQELIQELSRLMRHPNQRNRASEKSHKGSMDFKNGPLSGSSSDSRSSIGGVSNETGADDNYIQDRCFQSGEVSKKITNDNRPVIDRLLVDGLTPVKVMATDQLVQMLENESVWNLTFYQKSGLLEACMSICNSKRYSK